MSNSEKYSKFVVDMPTPPLEKINKQINEIYANCLFGNDNKQCVLYDVNINNILNNYDELEKIVRECNKDLHDKNRIFQIQNVPIYMKEISQNDFNQKVIRIPYICNLFAVAADILKTNPKPLSNTAVSLDDTSIKAIGLQTSYSMESTMTSEQYKISLPKYDSDYLLLLSESFKFLVTKFKADDFKTSTNSDIFIRIYELMKIIGPTIISVNNHLENVYKLRDRIYTYYTKLYSTGFGISASLEYAVKDAKSYKMSDQNLKKQLETLVAESVSIKSRPFVDQKEFLKSLHGDLVKFSTPNTKNKDVHEHFKKLAGEIKSSYDSVVKKFRASFKTVCKDLPDDLCAKINKNIDKKLEEDMSILNCESTIDTKKCDDDKKSCLYRVNSSNIVDKKPDKERCVATHATCTDDEKNKCTKDVSNDISALTQAGENLKEENVRGDPKGVQKKVQIKKF